VSINVGLGTGDLEQKMAMLTMISAKQEQALQQLGPVNPLVTPAQYSNTLRKIVELAGFKDSSAFFNAIPANYVPPQATQPPKPSPEEMLAQVQAQAIQADIQKKSAELQLEQQKALMADDRERDKIETDRFIKLRELELKYGAVINEQQLNMQVERDRMAMQAMQPQQGM
jgi:hypothetical protein